MLYDLYVDGKLTWTRLNWSTLCHHLAGYLKEPDENPPVIEFQALNN